MHIILLENSTVLFWEQIKIFKAYIIEKCLIILLNFIRNKETVRWSYSNFFYLLSHALKLMMIVLFLRFIIIIDIHFGKLTWSRLPTLNKLLRAFKYKKGMFRNVHERSWTFTFLGTFSDIRRRSSTFTEVGQRSLTFDIRWRSPKFFDDF